MSAAIMGNTALVGKTAFVTGASSGIGLASARILARDGAAVLLMGRREDALRQARDSILETVPKARIEIYAGDASAEAAAKAALQRARAIAGRLDILVPAVGGDDNYYPFLMETKDHFQYVLNRNLISAFLIMRYGAPLMHPHGGSIVCISTTTVTQQATGLAAYVAAKAGLERLVKLVALELGGAKIRVNAVRHRVHVLRAGHRGAVCRHHSAWSRRRTRGSRQCGTLLRWARISLDHRAKHRLRWWPGANRRHSRFPRPGLRQAADGSDSRGNSR
jgi:NAD(P)-dependent dehydrogenase (short-subunit alcohol dehydrogenase family)